MSNISFCEQEIDIEDFLSELALESSKIIAQNIPSEYRSSYLSTYAAGLLLNKNNHQEVHYV